MNLEQLLKSLSSQNWLEIPQELIAHVGTLVVTRKESEALLQSAMSAIDRGDVQRAKNDMYAGLLLDGKRFLAKLQKDGKLRISRFSYASEPLKSTVAALLTPGLGLRIATIEYVQSVANLYKVSLKVREEYEALRSWLETEKEVGIKSALASLDLLFLKASVGIHICSKENVDSRDPFFFTIEQMAEGFSSLLALYGNEFGLLTKNSSINHEFCIRDVYFHLLNSAAHLSQYREWEFQIDRFGYRLQQETPDQYRLVHPSPEFHRSVRLGFIEGEKQRALRTQDSFPNGGTSFHTHAKALVRHLEDAGCIELVTQPTERFRFGLPPDALKTLASVDELFLEEQLQLFHASRDLLTPIDQILEFEIEEGLNFLDILLAKRMIHFLSSITAAKLIPELKNRPGLVFQSIIPAFQRELIVSMLSNFVPEETACKVIDLWLTNIQGHVDIQYRPLIPTGDAILLPLNIFSGSNVVRNVLQSVCKRLYEDGKNDPLSAMLEKVFQGIGVKCKVGFVYDGGEIDVLVWIDGILFALECKNSLLPTNAHELRTSLDYVQTAGEQLERFKNRFVDSNFRNRVAAETGWAIDSTTHLCTGIIMSNRMFVGWKESGHPVRGAYELEHFVQEGTTSMGNESKKFWVGERFTGEDFRAFFENDITYLDRWAAMGTRSAKYVFDEVTVFVDDFYIDMLELAGICGFDVTKKRLLDQQAKFEEAVSEFSLVEHFRTLYPEKRDMSDN